MNRNILLLLGSLFISSYAIGISDIIRYFSYDKEDLELMACHQDENVGACRNFDILTYSKTQEIEKGISSIQDGEKFIIVFKGNIQANRNESGARYCEIMTRGNGFCFWNAAFGFDPANGLFKEHIDEIAEEQLSVISASQKEAIGAVLHMLTAWTSRQNPEATAITCDIMRLIINGNKAIIQHVQNSNSIKAVNYTLNALCAEVDPDLLFENPAAIQIWEAKKAILEVISYGIGIDIDRYPNILSNGSYPKTTLVYGSNTEIYDGKNNNSEEVFLSFDPSRTHFSRLIRESDLTALRQQAESAGIKVIEIDV